MSGPSGRVFGPPVDHNVAWSQLLIKENRHANTSDLTIVFEENSRWLDIVGQYGYN